MVSYRFSYNTFIGSSSIQLSQIFWGNNMKPEDELDFIVFLITGIVFTFSIIHHIYFLSIVCVLYLYSYFFGNTKLPKPRGVAP